MGLEDQLNTLGPDSLEPLKKENLVKVAAHYRITPAVGAIKSHILNLIKDHCVEHDIIDEVEEKPIAETAEIVRLKLDFEREERRLAREAEKALQDAQLAAQREQAQRAEAEAQKARDAEKAACEEARELRLAESVYQQYTDERSWNWHMTCQCLVIWGYVKPIIGFYNTFTGLASKETWQSGVKSPTLAS